MKQHPIQTDVIEVFTESSFSPVEYVWTEIYCEVLVVYLLGMLVSKGTEVYVFSGISRVFRADRVTLGSTVSCNDVPLDISFPPCPFSSTLTVIQRSLTCRGLALWQALCWPFDFLSNRIR